MQAFVRVAIKSQSKNQVPGLAKHIIFVPTAALVMLLGAISCIGPIVAGGKQHNRALPVSFGSVCLQVKEATPQLSAGAEG